MMKFLIFEAYVALKDEISSHFKAYCFLHINDTFFNDW